MVDINDGGPAFPRPFSEDKFNEDMLPSQRGMSLRDWFAGQALVGILSDGQYKPGKQWAADASASAYKVADEMLSARDVIDPEFEAKE